MEFVAQLSNSCIDEIQGVGGQAHEGIHPELMLAAELASRSNRMEPWEGEGDDNAEFGRAVRGRDGIACSRA
jgi:hypothetical protein